ncbi:hypothetical protein BJX76DRAFT_367792 [Aspergillus varians]
MRLPPPEVLLTWPTPNYKDPHTRGNAVLITSMVFTGFSIIITALRLYTRLRITYTAGVDDVLVVLGLGFAIAMSVIVCIATESWGWTRHIWDIPKEWMPMVSKLNLTFQILFSLSCSMVKLSLLWFCRRLLIVGTKGVYPIYNIAMIVGMVVVAISCALFVIISIFQCRPIHAYWDLDPQYPYHCLNDGAAVFSASVINIFTDILTTTLPMPLIWKLKLPTRQRLAVIAIFGLGIIVDVAGSFRTVYVWKSMIVSHDTTWEGWPVLLAGIVEINLGLICASTPALRPLVNFYVPRLLGSSSPYGYNRKTRSKSYKLRSFTGASKSRDSRLYGPHTKIPSEQLKVYRTVEMETHSEIRSSHQPMGNAYNISTNRRHSSISADEIHLTNDRERSVSPPTISIRSDTRGVLPSRENESV